jgi:hypothetical protein
MNNVSINNLSVRGKTTFAGDVSMTNVSILNLSITNLSLVNTTFSGTTIFGNYNANTQQLFNTNYNGYFNGIYNNTGTLELGSTTFQRHQLYYDGRGNMYMLWYASPTEYYREAGRFEVYGNNTGVANERRNGNLNIEFTEISLSATNINIASPLTPTYTSAPTINQIGYYSETAISGTFALLNRTTPVTTIDLHFGTWLIEFNITYGVNSPTNDRITIYFNKANDVIDQYLKRRMTTPLSVGGVRLASVIQVKGSAETWNLWCTTTIACTGDNVWVIKTRIA